MSSRPRPAAVWTLLSILLAEFALVAGYTVFLVFELLVDRPDSLSSAIALTVVVAIAAIWVGAIVVGMWRGAGWSRSAALVWQVLQFAVGVGALQGAFAQPAWGWPLVIASVLGFLLLTSPVTGRWLAPRG